MRYVGFMASQLQNLGRNSCQLYAYERRYVMKVKFLLTMENLVVNDNKIDQVTFNWEAEIERDDLLDLSQSWISSKNFLTSRMDGLTKVGESSLTIEPLDVEENVDEQW